jgi:hypothetical protein
VSDEDIVLQVHLLALLRTIVVLDVPPTDPSSSSTPPSLSPTPPSSSEGGQQVAGGGLSSLLLLAPPPAIASSPMFLQTLVVGLLQVNFLVSFIYLFVSDLRLIYAGFTPDLR